METIATMTYAVDGAFPAALCPSFDGLRGVERAHGSSAWTQVLGGAGTDRGKRPTDVLPACGRFPV